MGANSVLMVALFLAILAIVNFLAARHSIRWDFSENQDYTLAPETYRILRSLAKKRHHHRLYQGKRPRLSSLQGTPRELPSV